jgi:hypothetical protein
MQSKGGVDRAIIRIVLRNPDIPANELMNALRREGAPETHRQHAREIRRITRLVIEESTRVMSGTICNA